MAFKMKSPLPFKGSAFKVGGIFGRKKKKKEEKKKRMEARRAEIKKNLSEKPVITEQQRRDAREQIASDAKLKQEALSRLPHPR